MEVDGVKLYQRKLIFDDLSAMFYNSRGRERVGLAGGRAGWVFVGAEGGVTGGGGLTDRQICIQNLFYFSTVLQVTAAEVRPIC